MKGNWLLIKKRDEMVNIDKVIFINYKPMENFAKLVFWVQKTDGLMAYEVPIKKLSDREKAIVYRKLVEPGFKVFETILEEAEILAGGSDKIAKDITDEEVEGILD